MSGQSAKSLFLQNVLPSPGGRSRQVKRGIRIVEIIYNEVGIYASITARSGSSTAVGEISLMKHPVEAESVLTAIPVSPVSFFACHHLPLTSETSRISCFEKLISFASSGFASYEYIAFARYGYSVGDVTSLPTCCCSDIPAAAVGV